MGSNVSKLKIQTDENNYDVLNTHTTIIQHMVR
jgi:hypothetical protein